MASIVDVYVLLDVLLVILIALFIPIGFWRGAYREAFVTLGILFGASLGRFWGETWGIELAAVTRLQESGGAFMIAMLCLISATFLLGYSSGAALPVPEPGWVSRVLGALIAGANGALLLGFALRDIREYLLTADETGFLDNAYIAPFLSEGIGWILLVAAAVFVPIALVLALFGPDVEDEEFYEEDEFEVYDDVYQEPYAQRTMQRQGYAQPQPQAMAATRRAPSPAPAEETRPIPSARHPQASAEQQQPPQHAPPKQQPPAKQRAPQEQPLLQPQQPVNEEPPQTRRRVQQSGETQPHRPQFGPQPGRQPEQASPGEQTRPAPQSPLPESEPSFGTHSVEESMDEQQVVFGYRPSDSEATAAPRQRVEHHCPHCGEDVSNAEGSCPACGTALPASS